MGILLVRTGLFFYPQILQCTGNIWWRWELKAAFLNSRLENGLKELLSWLEFGGHVTTAQYTTDIIAFIQQSGQYNYFHPNANV